MSDHHWPHQPRPKPGFITCDTSDWRTGATLSVGPSWKLAQLVTSDSIQLKGPEKNYPVHEKELLAIIHSLKKLWADLLGIPIVVYTDHRTLENFDTEHNLSHQQLHKPDRAESCFCLGVLRCQSCGKLIHPQMETAEMKAQILRNCPGQGCGDGLEWITCCAQTLHFAIEEDSMEYSVWMHKGFHSSHPHLPAGQQPAHTHHTPIMQGSNSHDVFIIHMPSVQKPDPPSMPIPTSNLVTDGKASDSTASLVKESSQAVMWSNAK